MPGDCLKLLSLFWEKALKRDSNKWTLPSWCVPPSPPSPFTRHFSPSPFTGPLLPLLCTHIKQTLCFITLETQTCERVKVTAKERGWFPNLTKEDFEKKIEQRVWKYHKGGNNKINFDAFKSKGMKFTAPK